MTEDPRVQRLLDELLDSDASPDEVCASCPELLPTVQNRWHQLRRVRAKLDALFPLSDELVPDAVESRALPQIPGYEVEAVLGRGATGVVFKVKHRGLNRFAALKMLLAGPFASAQQVARFARESRAIAELQHPHIIQIYDVGELEGRPYFTMELVEGGSLAQDLAGAPIPARRAAELTATLARAAHSAHVKGIIHRDLKPANILLTGDGTPKIADFGLARHVEGDPRLTASDARVGTPSYMAPEQAVGKSGAIGQPADIYALGSILYEMLTGRPPFRAETAIETQRQVINADAVPPSRLNANVPRDLETICLKCLQKDPSRRYASALDLADDVDRFLHGRPVRARPVGRVERAWRWGRRNRGMAASLLGVASLLTLIVVGSLWAAAHFRMLEGDQRKLAKDKGELAEEKGKLLVEKERERAKAVSAEMRATVLRRESDAQAKELRNTLYLTEMNLAGQAATDLSGLGRVAELLARWGHGRPDLRGWEWYYLNGLSHRSLATRLTHSQSIQHLAWSPSGKRLASAGSDRTVCIWDDFDERPPLRLTGHSREVFSVAWSPDGRRLASASWDGTVRIWDATSGAEIRCLQGHTAEVYCVAWSPDGKTIGSGGRDRTIRIWDADSGAIHHVLGGHEDTVSGLSWRSDSRRLASASHDGTVRLWDSIAGKAIRILHGHGNWVHRVAWSPDGSRLASASNDQTVRIWDPDTGRESRALRGHTQGVSSVAWSPDGTHLATSSDDQTVKVWVSATGAQAFTLRGHSAALTTVAWNPRGDRLASGGYERAIKVWDPSAGAEVPALRDHQDSVHALAWCQRDSKLCASGDDAGMVKIWDVPRHKVRWSLQGDQRQVNSVAWHPTATCLAITGATGMVRIWNPAAGSETVVLGAHAGEVFSVAWHPDGRRLASGGFDKMIRIWDVTARTESRVIAKHEGTVYAVAWSPDGRHLASASADRTVRVWDAATGAELRCYRGHQSQVVTVAWSPDGTRLASAGYDQAVHLWDATAGRRTALLRGHTTHLAQVIWNPDGTRLASASRDGTVRVWDTRTGKEALTLASHEGQVHAVAWSPDSMILASAGQDRQIRFHDATAGYLAARAPQMLPAIDRRLAADPSLSADWRLRAEVYAQRHKWKQAGEDAREYLLLSPRRRWFLFDCLVAGPYAADLKERCLPEDAALLDAKEPEDSEIPAAVNWKTVPDGTQGIVDFGTLIGRNDNTSAYALFPVYSLDDRQVAILVGADDQARLWLNGECLYESSRSGPAVADQDAISATLKAGWNTLLVRVANDTGAHELFLRLSDAPVDLARVRRAERSR